MPRLRNDSELVAYLQIVRSALDHACNRPWPFDAWPRDVGSNPDAVAYINGSHEATEALRCLLYLTSDIRRDRPALASPKTATPPSTIGLQHLSPKAVGVLMARRAEARASKNWTRADEIRDDLASLGVSVSDTRGASTWSYRLP